jgi:manganese transport protein
VQTRKITRTEEGFKSAIKFNLFDTVIALNLAFFVNAAILILAATAFFKNGYFEVAEIQDAYKLLEHIFGKIAPVLFAIALIASGQSSTITGTLAGQIIMEGHINLRIEPWLRRFAYACAGHCAGGVHHYLFWRGCFGKPHHFKPGGIKPYSWAFAVIPLIHFTSDKKRMGKFAISLKVKILAWASAVLIVGLNAKLVYDQLGDWLKDSQHQIYTFIFLLCR